MLRITGTLGGSARPPGGFFIARSELKPAVTGVNPVTRQSCPLCGRLAGHKMSLRAGSRLLRDALTYARHFVLSYSPRSGISRLPLSLMGWAPALT